MVEEVAIYIFAHSLIKHLTPLEDDAKIPLLHVLISLFANKQRITFIQIDSPKIDLHFEVFKQL